MNEPISVVMAVHNGRRYLDEQMRSILDQLHEDDELVVIDDASGDDSVAKIQALADSRLKLHRNPVNLGIRATFERGFAQARHEIVFLSDQDDVWIKGKRDALVAAFHDDPAVLVVLSDSELIDADGALIAPSFMATRGGFHGSWWSTLVRNRYLGCSMAVRRRLFDVALPVPAWAPMHDMWLGAIGSIVGKVVYLPAVYLRYRRHGSNATPSFRRSVPVMLARRTRFLLAIAARLLWVSITRRSRRPTAGRKSAS